MGDDNATGTQETLTSTHCMVIKCDMQFDWSSLLYASTSDSYSL